MPCRPNEVYAMLHPCSSCKASSSLQSTMQHAGLAKLCRPDILPHVKMCYMQVAVSKGHSAFDDQTKIEEQLAAFLLAEKLPVYLEFNSGSTSKIFGSGIMKQVNGRPAAGKCIANRGRGIGAMSGSSWLLQGPRPAILAQHQYLAAYGWLELSSHSLRTSKPVQPQAACAVHGQAKSPQKTIWMPYIIDAHVCFL